MILINRIRIINIKIDILILSSLYFLFNWIITCSSKVAKKICLSTKSTLGKQVQQYFLDLEVVLCKYKNYIIEDMNKNAIIRK